jgi:broad specificity phosphatase PhoE
VRALVGLTLTALVALAPFAARASETIALAEVAKPGRVLMLRHALAPGTGDPPDFQVGDCATQRNLDARGRAQAAALGKRLADAGVRNPRIHSSQWCRCLETARELGLGPVVELPALNSLFGRPQNRELQVAALRKLLAELPPTGAPVVWVSHSATIFALTGQSTPSGGGVVLALDGTPDPKVLGRIEAD